MRGGSDSVVWPATAEVAIVTHAANPATANCGLARLDTLTLVTLLAMLAAGASNAPTEGLAGWTVKLMDQLGLAGAAIAVSLDNFFPPIPSEIILPLAGFAASQGTFSLGGAIAATTFGSVFGAMVLYYLGVIFGRDRVRAAVERVPLLKVSDVDKAEAWFAKYGAKAVFFGRMVPIFRSVISIPAGIEKMNVFVFFLLTTAGSLIWNSVFVYAGYRLGENWDAVEPYSSAFQKIVILGVLALVAIFVFVRVRDQRVAR